MTGERHRNMAFAPAIGGVNQRATNHPGYRAEDCGGGLERLSYGTTSFSLKANRTSSAGLEQPALDINRER